MYFVYVDSTGTQHGLVAATADEPGGAAYTWTAAQTLCDTKTTGGFNDWILPNKAQLTALFNNRYPIDPSDPNRGFSDSLVSDTRYYWSSTMSDQSSSPWSQLFGSGDQTIAGPTSQHSVRCIQTF